MDTRNTYTVSLSYLSPDSALGRELWPNIGVGTTDDRTLSRKRIFIALGQGSVELFLKHVCELHLTWLSSNNALFLIPTYIVLL